MKIKNFIPLMIILMSILPGCGRSLKTNELHNQNLKNYDQFTPNKPVNTPKNQNNYKPKKPQGIKKDIKVHDINLSSLANILNKTYNAKISSINNNSVDLRISCDYKGVTLDYVLNDLLDKYNMGFEKTESGYLIYPPQIKSRMFHLSYHNFERSGSSSVSTNNNNGGSTGGNIGGISGGSSGNSGSASVQTSTESTFWQSITEAINVIIQDDKTVQDAQVFGSGYKNSNLKSGAISIDKNSGIIIVRAYPRALKMVEKFIENVKRNYLKQVIIEVRVLEVSLGDQFSSGIDWSFIKKNQTTPLVQFDSIGENPGKSMINFPGLFSSSLSIGTDNIFKAIVSMLSNQGTVSVLSAPQVSVINNQKALVKYGDNITFINSTNTTTVPTGGSAIQNSGFSTQSYFSGIALDITPTITDDRVVLHIHPVITSITEDIKAVPTGDPGKQNTISVPKISNKEADTIVKAKSGDVIVIGGLSYNTTSMTQSGPGGKERIMSLLGGMNKSKTSKEIIILVRPLIIDSYDGYDMLDTKKYMVKESLVGF